MLAEIARYALARGLDTEAGFRSKDVKWLLLFEPSGDFVCIAPYGVVKRGRAVAKCPHLQFSGDTPMRQFLVDTAEYYALLDGEAGDAKLRRKHAYAIQLLAQAGDALPELAAIAASMAKSETIDTIRSALIGSKAKPADNVTPALVQPGGERRIFLEEASWHDWWRSFYPTLLTIKKSRRGSGGVENGVAKSRSLMSGLPCNPALTHPKVRGLGKEVGGRVETALVSFEPHAFRSYRLKQSENAPVSGEEANTYVVALNTLIETTGQLLGNVKVIHWYVGKDEKPVDLLSHEDPFRQVESMDDLWGPPAPDVEVKSKNAKKRNMDAERRATEQHAQSLARDFLRSVKSGARADMADYRYHTMALSGSSARVMVRDYVTGRFGDLCKSVMAWFSDLEIVSRDGKGLAQSPKFGAVLGAMVRELKDIPPPMAVKLWRCAVRGDKIPEPFAIKAFRRATSDLVDQKDERRRNAFNHARMGLLRAYLRRKGDHDVKPHLNEEHPDPGYHCGRLLAVLDDIQYAALGDVGAGIVQRYYAAASSTPALVLGRLIRLANTGHLPKLDYDRRQRLEQRLAGVWSHLRQDPPTTLSLTQQTLFAMGYYQQKASH